MMGSFIAALQQNSDYKECKKGPRKGSLSVPHSSVTYDSIKDTFNFIPRIFPEGEHLITSERINLSEILLGKN
jgi:hypothetical protein